MEKITVNVYFDLDYSLYPGHVTGDLLAAWFRPKQMLNSLKKRRLKSFKLVKDAFKLLFTTVSDYKKGDFTKTQKIWKDILQDSTDKHLEELLIMGAKKSFRRKERKPLEEKVNHYNKIIENSGFDIKAYYLSIEPIRLQKIIASKSKINIEECYQKVSVIDKLEYVKQMAKKYSDKPRYTVFIDDKVKDQVSHKYKLIILNKMEDLPTTLNDLDKEHLSLDRGRLTTTYSETQIPTRITTI